MTGLDAMASGRTSVRCRAHRLLPDEDKPARRGRAIGLAVWVVFGVSCSQGPIAPTTETPPSSGPVTEAYSSTLPVGGSKFYSFSTAASGAVTATLVDIGGAGVPPTVIVNLGIGTPAGTTCSAASSPVQVTGDAGIATQVSGTQPSGVSCVIVTDIGNLFAPASFTVSIEHP